ncbi:major tail protein [Rossellomorea sp. BNER]|uniref:major tail protein n=1 Tax=Rossellomorea sp. BNER TaxID=2962031 RepID=UPI003AF2B65D|nr:phage tail protein [Rossellomorea sp. BNER]
MPYATGLKSFNIATLTTDDTTGTVYATPKKLPEGISVQVEPNVATGRLFGDNRTVATASKFNYATVTINTTELPAEDEALLLGKTLDTDGVLKDMGGTAPYVAFGFEVTMDDGSSEYWWLLKGKFSEPSRTNNTATDSIEFGTPTIAGEFIQRESDGEWKFVGAEGNTGFTAGATWFDKVYEKPTV